MSSESRPEKSTKFSTISKPMKMQNCVMASALFKYSENEDSRVCVQSTVDIPLQISINSPLMSNTAVSPCNLLSHQLSRKCDKISEISDAWTAIWALNTWRTSGLNRDNLVQGGCNSNLVYHEILFLVRRDKKVGPERSRSMCGMWAGVRKIGMNERKRGRVWEKKKGREKERRGKVEIKSCNERGEERKGGDGY